MNLIVYSINLAWVPFFMKLASEKGDDAKPVVSQLNTYYCLFIFFIGLALAIFSKEIVLVLTTEDYSAANIIVPILTFQFMLTGLYYMMASKIVYVKRAVRYLPVLTISSAAVNIGMNYLLTPVYGMTGAAWSAVISSSFLLLIAFVISQKAYHIRYDYRRILLIALTAILLFATYYFLKRFSIQMVFSLLIKTVILITYLVLLYILGFFKKSEIDNLKDIYQKVRNRYIDH